MKNSARRTVVLLMLGSVALLVMSCAPAATPTPTPSPVPTSTPTVVVATPTPRPTATPVPVATSTPVEEKIPTPTPVEEKIPTPTPVEEKIPTPTPEVVPEEVLYLPELPRITCEELKQAMGEGVGVVLVDTRIDFSFKEGHIPGAINIPDTPLPPLTEEMIEEKLLGLPRDRLIALYCD